MNRRGKATALTIVAAVLLLCAGCKGQTENGGASSSPATKSSQTASKNGGASSSPTSKSSQTASGVFVEPKTFKGVMFNPNIEHNWMDGYYFPVFYTYFGTYQMQMRETLAELASKGFNYIDIFLCNVHTMKDSKTGNKAGQPIEEWGNLDYLDSFAIFLNDCYNAGISVHVDLVDNRWVPYLWDSENHLAQPGGWWPMADEDPWNEAATWYTEVITYLEGKVKHLEAIAAWGMMGNYQFGSAEPVLWQQPRSVSYEYTEQFVKNVWPQFIKAGTRPKASPIMLPIFEKNGYWADKTPDERLQAFHNLKKWLVDDLGLPPDYWVMTTYTFCDPAQDGYNYLKRINEILSDGNDAPIISTDIKCPPAQDNETKNTIAYKPGATMAEAVEWHLKKVQEYGYKGWWFWSYQDDPKLETGLRKLDGQWKTDVLDIIKRY